MYRVTVILAAAALVTACAATPESIAPAYVSDLQFQSLTCDQLVEETTRVEQALSQASAQQNRARSNDTWGVILLGLPVSSLSGGNVAEQIAQLKGYQVALAKQRNLKNCARGGAAAPAAP